jgi:hypothetical protein
MVAAGRLARRPGAASTTTPETPLGGDEWISSSVKT